MNMNRLLWTVSWQLNIIHDCSPHLDSASQYRQMRRKEQDRLVRMEVDYQKRKEVAEFNMRREERLKAAEERTAKKRLKRQKKKQKKKEKRNKTNLGGEENNQKEESSDDDKNSDDDATELNKLEPSFRF